MRLLTPALTALIVAAGTAAAAPPYPPVTPLSEWDLETPGGFKMVRKNGTTITSLGGMLAPRWVRITEPDGMVSRFKYPSEFRAPPWLTEPRCARGFAEIHIPDARGLLYVNDDPKPMRGAALDVQTPFLKAGERYTLQLRAAFRAGDELLIEDRTITVGGGETTVVRFDGVNAVRVPLREKMELLPPPRMLPENAPPR